MILNNLTRALYIVRSKVSLFFYINLYPLTNQGLKKFVFITNHISDQNTKNIYALIVWFQVTEFKNTRSGVSSYARFSSFFLIIFQLLCWDAAPIHCVNMF